MYLQLCLALIAAFVAYKVFLWLLWLRKLNKALADIPVMDKCHWLLGNIPQVRAAGGFVPARAEAFKRLGVQTIKAYLGPIPILITRDIDMFKYIHNNQSTSSTPFQRAEIPMLNPVVGDTGIVVTEGEEWAFHRKNLEPLFHLQNLNDIYPMVIEHCRRLEHLWLQECAKNPITKTADIFVDDHMRAFTTGITAWVAFSVDIGVLKTADTHPMVQRFIDITASMESLGTLPTFIQRIPWLPERRHLDREVAKADQEMLAEIKMRRAGAASAENHRDVLDLLLKADVKPPYTDRGIRDQCMMMYFGGQETTSLLVAWGLYYMAREPDVQTTLFEALQDLPEQFTFADLNRIEYLTYFVNETLRLASIAPSNLRQSSTDATFYKGLHLPAGLWCVSAITDVHHHPVYFPDPLQFDPSRWADPKRHLMDAFVPFTKGEKICVGQKLSLMEGKALFAHLVPRFRFTVVPGFEVACKAISLCRPKNGMKLRISVRD